MVVLAGSEVQGHPSAVEQECYSHLRENLHTKQGYNYTAYYYLLWLLVVSSTLWYLSSCGSNKSGELSRLGPSRVKGCFITTL